MFVKEPHRQLIYKLDLRGDRESLINEFKKWHFVRTSPTQPVVAIAGGILGIGTNDGTTFDHPPIKEMLNVSVDCEFRIKDYGGDPSRWAGIRVRGFQDNIMFGYLAYMRSAGTVELYRAGEVLAGANEIKVSDTKDTWTKIRLDIFESDIRVWVNGKVYLTETDTRFRDKGLVYLHTFGVHAQVREFAIYELHKFRE